MDILDSLNLNDFKGDLKSSQIDEFRVNSSFLVKKRNRLSLRTLTEFLPSNLDPIPCLNLTIIMLILNLNLT